MPTNLSEFGCRQFANSISQAEPSRRHDVGPQALLVISVLHGGRLAQPIRRLIQARHQTTVQISSVPDWIDVGARVGRLWLQ
jgi:hypothetical protein